MVGVLSTGVSDNETKTIIVNPYIFCRGKKVERLVADFFYDSVWNKKKDKKQEM